MTASQAIKLENKTKLNISTFIEEYISGKIDINENLPEFFANLDDNFNYHLTWNHIKYFFSTFVPETIFHTRKQDARVAVEHYDRGHDFFRCFLGERMVYTSAYWLKPGDGSLEDAQDRKMQMICNKTMMKAGDSHLDLGCGWGTFVTYAAKHFNTNSTGITIAADGAKYGQEQVEQHGLLNTAKVLCQDYRDALADNNSKYNHITCLEMAEHVGVRRYQKFINSVYNKLEDDGVFYLQQCGLRANPGLFKSGQHWEDLVWGLFMAKYIFPGADASTPLGFIVNALQKANFEVQSVENMSIHYGETIRQWHLNWEGNKDYILEHYGQFWYRLWRIFLCWSVKIASQGSSALWSIVAHKNLNQTHRKRYFISNQLDHDWHKRLIKL